MPDELQVLGLNDHPPGVDGTELGVGKQVGQVVLGGFLEGGNRGRLKAQIGLEVIGNLLHESLEGQFSDEQITRLLWVHMA